MPICFLCKQVIGNITNNLESFITVKRQGTNRIIRYVGDHKRIAKALKIGGLSKIINYPVYYVFTWLERYHPDYA